MKKVLNPRALINSAPVAPAPAPQQQTGLSTAVPAGAPNVKPLMAAPHAAPPASPSPMLAMDANVTPHDTLVAQLVAQVSQLQSTVTSNEFIVRVAKQAIAAMDQSDFFVNRMARVIEDDKLTGLLRTKVGVNLSADTLEQLKNTIFDHVIAQLIIRAKNGGMLQSDDVQPIDAPPQTPTDHLGTDPGASPTYRAQFAPPPSGSPADQDTIIFQVGIGSSLKPESIFVQTWAIGDDGQVLPYPAPAEVIAAIRELFDNNREHINFGAQHFCRLFEAEEIVPGSEAETHALPSYVLPQ